MGFRPAHEPGNGTGDLTRTTWGLRSGTVPYMSPEQARGVPSDYRSDQFSFGLVLFEMATGRPAFRRDNPAATLDAIINDEPQQPSGITPRMPVMFGWIVERCLAKEPSERYAATSDLHRDLKTLRDRFSEAASQHLQADAVPAGPRHAMRLLVAAGVLALVASAILFALSRDAFAPVSTGAQFGPIATDAVYEGLSGLVTGRRNHRLRPGGGTTRCRCLPGGSRPPARRRSRRRLTTASTRSGRLTAAAFTSSRWRAIGRASGPSPLRAAPRNW
jgi:hypothetical protein